MGSGIDRVKAPRFDRSASWAIFCYQFEVMAGHKQLGIPWKSHTLACHHGGAGQCSTWRPYRSNIWGTWESLQGPPPGCSTPLLAESKNPARWVPAVVCHHLQAVGPLHPCRTSYCKMQPTHSWVGWGVRTWKSTIHGRPQSALHLEAATFIMLQQVKARATWRSQVTPTD
jgi:hypothetical protein